MTALKNFDTDLDLAGTSRLVKPRVVMPVVTERVAVTLTPSAKSSFVMKPDSEWVWDDLRDYVVRSIENRHGPFPRDFAKEAGIFKAFLNRWGVKAPAIARFAFEQQDGMWMGAPVSIYRFCINNDRHFAQPIADRL